MMADDKKKDGKKKDYEVGYGRPPKQTRFSSSRQPASRGSRKGVPNFSTEVKRILQAMADKSSDPDASAMSLLASRLVQMALGEMHNGERITFDQRLRAMRELLDRMEGKPAQKIAGDPDSPIHLNIEWLIPKPVDDPDFAPEDFEEGEFDYLDFEQTDDEAGHEDQGH